MEAMLSQIIEGYYKNSPEWPLDPPPDLDAEVDAYMADGTSYSREEVRAEIARFWADEMRAREAKAEGAA